MACSGWPTTCVADLWKVQSTLGEESGSGQGYEVGINRSSKCIKKSHKKYVTGYMISKARDRPIKMDFFITKKLHVSKSHHNWFLMFQWARSLTMTRGLPIPTP